MQNTTLVRQASPRPRDAVVISVIALGIVALLINIGPLVALGDAVLAGSGPVFAGVAIGVALTTFASFTYSAWAYRASYENADRESRLIGDLVADLELERMRLQLDELRTQFPFDAREEALSGALKVSQLAIVLRKTPEGFVVVLRDRDKVIVSPAQESQEAAQRIAFERYTDQATDPMSLWHSDKPAATSA